MSIISHMSVDYDAPVVEVQSDSSATDLENAKVPTGQTIKSYLNANNNIVPISETDYAALTPAQKQNGKAYFRYEADSIMRDIQDNASATDLNSGDLPTGQTIKSYLNSNLTWGLLASSTGSTTLNATIPSTTHEIMFLYYEPNTKIFSSKIYPENRVAGSAISVVFEGTSDNTNLIYAAFTRGSGSSALSAQLKNAQWGGNNYLSSSTLYVYAR